LSRNYNLGSRDMGRAGKMALNSASQSGAVSFSTAATNGERWGEFAQFARQEMGIKYMEGVTTDTVVAYGERLQERVEAGKMSAATAQNYVSAVNSVMKLATEGAWQSVSPTKDCGIDQRSGIASENKAISNEKHAELTGGALSERLSAIMDLQRSMGLRFEESAKLDAVKALKEVTERGTATIEAGTKGGLAREVPASPQAVAALERASSIQGSDRSMIPASNSYREFQQAAYKELREAGGNGFHGQRHSYAQERYEALTGASAPVAEGWAREERFERLADALGVSMEEAKAIDHDARMQIAEELGHGRQEVTNAYLG
jgi:site-specific recombinase XerC